MNEEERRGTEQKIDRRGGEGRREGMIDQRRGGEGKMGEEWLEDGMGRERERNG